MTTKKQAKPVKAAKAPTPSERLNAIGIEAICAYVASGESLRSWCKASGFDQATTLNWINADDGRAKHYAQAREDRADAVFEMLDDVSDQAVKAGTAVEVNGLRLKADNIKWKLARMNPKKFGDKLDLNHSGKIELSDDQVETRLSILLQKAAQNKAC